MHWVNVDFNNDDSVEFQLYLNDYFPNIDLNIDNDFFLEKRVDRAIKENNDYQTVLFENNTCRNKSEDNNVDFDVKNVYS